MTGTFNIADSIAAQIEYCKNNNYPNFMPNGGVCWSCRLNIFNKHKNKYNPERDSGISVEEAGSTLITGCPHCNRSYCD